MIDRDLLAILIYLLMDEIQENYRQQLLDITVLKISPRAKAMLIENLINRIKEVEDLGKNYDLTKCRGNYDILSTSISECHSINYQMEKDVDEI